MTASERVARFWSRVQQGPGCWEWQGSRLPNGYGQTHVGRTPAGKIINDYAHRVAYRLTHGSIPSGLVVRHSCDNPPCCNPAHLLIGTQADNIADAQRQGKYHGERPDQWVVEPALRRALIAQLLLAPHGAIKRLARKHGVNYPMLYQAVVRERHRLNRSALRVS